MLSTAHKALHHRTRWTGSKQNCRNTSYWHLQTDLTGKVKICESDCHVRKLCTANNPCSNRSSFSSVWPENDEKYSVSNIYSIQYSNACWNRTYQIYPNLLIASRLCHLRRDPFAPMPETVAWLWLSRDWGCQHTVHCISHCISTTQHVA